MDVTDIRARLRGAQGTVRHLHGELVGAPGLRLLALVGLLTLQLGVAVAGLRLLAPIEQASVELAACSTVPCVGALEDEPAASGPGRTSDDPVPVADEPAVPEPSASGGDGQGAGQRPPDGEVADDGSDAAAEATEATESAEPDGLRATSQFLRQWGRPRVQPPDIDEVVPSPRDLVTTDLASRRMPYGPFAAQAADIVAALPSLHVLQRHFSESAMTRDVAAQLERIAELDGLTDVSVEGYEAFAVDRSRRDAFADAADYHERIEPRMFVVHWTGIGFDDVDHFTRSLKPYRVQYYLDREARAYDLFEADDHKPAHARGANDFSQGVEIDTGDFDGRWSPLFSYTPEQIEATVYLAVEFLRRNDLPVDESTIVGHYAADLIFSNPYYDPFTGTFNRDRVRKFDPPQELMRVIVDRARQLDETLTTRASARPGETGPVERRR